MPCPKIERCPLYPEFKLELSLRVWQTDYCNTEDRFQECARYKLATSGVMPEPRLLPNGELLAESQEQ